MKTARDSKAMRRMAFLTGVAALPCALATAPVAPPADPSARAGSALVFGGGGARGAYEAGVIEGLRRAANARDGERIAGIDVVCGTSIGAVNAWFVATGQYTALANLWHAIASEQIFVLKHRYETLVRASSGVLTRIDAALALVSGLTTNVQGILDGTKVAAWLDTHIDPHAALIIPFVFTVTNLDRERAEVFYRIPFQVSDAARAVALTRLHSSAGPTTAIRVATDAILRPALRASAAIPVLFDPVVLAAPEGSLDRYVDGGVADNSPIDVARALSTAVYLVMVDAAVPARQSYANALEVGVGAFGVAQTRILEKSLRSTYLETRGKRLFAPGVTVEQRLDLDGILDADLYTVQPQTDLPVEVVEFDRQQKIDAAYDAGLRDIARGWTPYRYG